MSFCTVPRSAAGSTPWRSPTTWYMASRMGAVALIVNEVDTRSSGMPSKIASMSASESIATPTFPTSPSASLWSEFSPIWVGRSSATESPVCPWLRR